MIRCSEKRNGKLLKVPCKKRPLFLRSEKPVLHRMIFDLSSLVTCSPRPLLLPLVLQKWEFHSSVCMVPALQWENHSLLELSPYLPGYGHHILCATSSHFATAEKEFRFPLGYGCQRPLSATWTVTGSAACILSPEAPHPSEIVGSSLLRSTLGSVAITGITTGKVIDFGFRDSLNMGGCMAPAACDTIYRHFEDFGRSVNDYDAVLTGDLGVVGRQILLDLLKEKNIDLSSVHQDCGLLIYDNQKQDTHSGRQRLWLCSLCTCRLYSSPCRVRLLETCPLCTDRRHAFQSQF